MIEPDEDEDLTRSQGSRWECVSYDAAGDTHQRACYSRDTEET
jgi:hypothetical protein